MTNRELSLVFYRVVAQSSEFLKMKERARIRIEQYPTSLEEYLTQHTKLPDDLRIMEGSLEVLLKILDEGEEKTKIWFYNRVEREISRSGQFALPFGDSTYEPPLKSTAHEPEDSSRGEGLPFYEQRTIDHRAFEQSGMSIDNNEDED